MSETKRRSDSEAHTGSTMLSPTCVWLPALTGLFVIQVLRAMGCGKIIAVDLEDEKLKPLHFVIRHTANDKYECFNAERAVTSQLTVDSHGIVQSHTGHWIAQK